MMPNYTTTTLLDDWIQTKTLHLPATVDEEMILELIDNAIKDGSHIYLLLQAYLIGSGSSGIGGGRRGSSTGSMMIPTLITTTTTTTNTTKMTFPPPQLALTENIVNALTCKLFPSMMMTMMSSSSSTTTTNDNNENTNKSINDDDNNNNIDENNINNNNKKTMMTNNNYTTKNNKLSICLDNNYILQTKETSELLRQLLIGSYPILESLETNMENICSNFFDLSTNHPMTMTTTTTTTTMTKKELYDDDDNDVDDTTTIGNKNTKRNDDNNYYDEKNNIIIPSTIRYQPKLLCTNLKNLSLDISKMVILPKKNKTFHSLKYLGMFLSHPDCHVEYLSLFCNCRNNIPIDIKPLTFGIDENDDDNDNKKGVDSSSSKEKQEEQPQQPQRSGLAYNTSLDEFVWNDNRLGEKSEVIESILNAIGTKSIRNKQNQTAKTTTAKTTNDDSNDDIESSTQHEKQQQGQKQRHHYYSNNLTKLTLIGNLGGTIGLQTLYNVLTMDSCTITELNISSKRQNTMKTIQNSWIITGSIPPSSVSGTTTTTRTTTTTTAAVDHRTNNTMANNLTHLSLRVGLQCQHVDTLLQTHSVLSPNLEQIDLEGNDIESLNFKQFLYNNKNTNDNNYININNPVGDGKPRTTTTTIAKTKTHPGHPTLERIYLGNNPIVHDHRQELEHIERLLILCPRLTFIGNLGRSYFYGCGSAAAAGGGGRGGYSNDSHNDNINNNNDTNPQVDGGSVGNNGQGFRHHRNRGLPKLLVSWCHASSSPRFQFWVDWNRNGRYLLLDNVQTNIRKSRNISRSDVDTAAGNGKNVFSETATTNSSSSSSLVVIPVSLWPLIIDAIQRRLPTIERQTSILFQLLQGPNGLLNTLQSFRADQKTIKN